MYLQRGEQPQEHQVFKRERRSMIAAIHPSKGIVSFKTQKMPFNGSNFLKWLDDDLSNVLLNTKAVIMDNVAFHKTKDVRNFFESKGIKIIYIPPYSPRCNPIEEVFSLIKRKFRSSFSEPNIDKRITMTMENIKQYKDLLPFYNHTRQHVSCHTFKS